LRQDVLVTRASFREGDAMSLIFVNLRWNDPGADRYEEIIHALPQDGDLPPGCLSRQLRRGGGALLATETWDDEASDGRMDHLVIAMRAAGIEEAPQTAMFSVPAIFDVAYRRRGAATSAPANAATAVIPTQRAASEGERLRGNADASVPAGTRP
jgi:hypothetical protein